MQPPLPGIVVRAAKAADTKKLAALFAEMQCHYGRPVPAIEALAAAALACRPRSGIFDPYTLLAFRDEAVFGSLVLNVTFPATGLTRSLYIRDLYVAAAARRQGVGRCLLNAASAVTMKEGYSALDWTTTTDNTPARAMYEAMGACLQERAYYRMTRDFLMNSGLGEGPIQILHPDGPSLAVELVPELNPASRS